MQTFVIVALLTVLFILVLGVSTRIVEDLTIIELDVMEIKRRLKNDNRNTNNNHDNSAR